MVTNSEIRRTLEAFLNRYPEESDALAEVHALAHGDVDLTSRSLHLHFTVGAILVNRNRRVLVIHHRALGRWLTPGGHIELADETLIDAARRELEEETGLGPGDVTLISPLPVDIDRHTIPGRGDGDADHIHVDVRYCFFAREPQVNLRTEEVDRWEWRSPTDVPGASTGRRLSGWLDDIPDDTFR